jgi:GABA(A) receptor-associated protein
MFNLFHLFNSSQLEIQAKRKEADRVLTKYPDRVPIIVTRSTRCSDVALIDKNKFLVPADLTVGQFQYVIRKRLTLTPDKALFLFIGGSIVPTSETIGNVYSKYCDEKTHFLYADYSSESVFG